MSALTQSDNEVTIVLDASLTPSNAQPLQYPVRGGISAANCEFNGFKGSHPLHGFVLTLHEAYSHHRTLALIPDDLWTIILQGVGQHVAKTPEQLRHKLVQHQEGRVLINVVRDEFVRGKTTLADWDGVVKELTGKVLEHATAGSVVHSMQVQFSTTTPLHSTLYATSVLSTLQHYASYRVDTLCGIPRVIMRGTVEDWKTLLVQFEALKLAEFSPGLAMWSRLMTILLERLVRIRENATTNIVLSEDVDFLKGIYKYQQSSGGATVTGWVTGLFPYLGRVGETKESTLTHHLPALLKKLTTPCPPKPTTPPSTPNSWMFSSTPSMPGAKAYKDAQDAYYTADRMHYRWLHSGSVSSDSFPSGLTDVPFMWNYVGEQLPMTMYVGFDVPDVDNATGTISTRLGFAIAHR